MKVDLPVLDASTLARFRSKIGFADWPACWEWTGGLSASGYGRFAIGRRMYLAHRVSFAVFVCGGLDRQLELDHLCRNRSCVNPLHLDQVTHGVNAIRGVGITNASAARLARTHCANGHPWTPENTYYPPGPCPQRMCRLCRRAEQQRRYWRDKRSVQTWRPGDG